MRVLALLALVLLLAGPAAAQGTLTLYTSESLDKVNEMKTDFEKRQPGTTVNIYRSGTQVVIGKLQAEIQAGAVQADLVWMADIDFFAQLGRKNLLLPYNPPEADRAPAKFRYEGGRYHEVRLIFNTVGFNTLRLKERPTSWKDLADARYKGKVGMASPFYSGAAFSTLGTLVPHPAFGWGFFRGLKDNAVVVEQSNGTVAQKLATGEFVVASVVDFFLRDMKAKGSPVDHVWPREGAILIPTPIGIVQGARNLPAAQAFLRYLYSADGQRLFAQQGYVPVLPGIEGPKGMPPEKLEILATDEAYIAAHREELKAKYRELFETK
ncbi:MAG: ABC transporter substrate-binding protein [Candidatus Rokubacteria bacterium]|nr:ABC transporter substrate-binding protein [Candidatus Rokubacteria bacterium]